jgi:Kef-type K+ transport system membrane component KefB
VFDLPLLLIQLLVILASARAAGRVAHAIGQPRVVGEMFAGIVLGPSVLGVIAPGVIDRLFPAGRLVPLNTLSQLGVILFMFIVGLRFHLAVLRGLLRSAVVISAASIIAPFLLGSALAWWIYPRVAAPTVASAPFMLFVGSAMSITAFPVLARILAERGLTTTRLGAIATACAAVDDVTAWCLLAAVVAVARSGNALQQFAMTLAAAVVYTAAMATIGHRVLQWWSARRGSEVSADVVAIAVLLALASALATELLGLHPLFGAFLAGAIVPRTGALADSIAERVDSVVGTVLLPVFFMYTGLLTDMRLVASAGLWDVFAAIMAAAVLGKLAGSALAARLTGMSGRESLAIGVLMNTRGLMELVILTIGLETGVIGPALFSMMVLMAIVTTVMTSPALMAIGIPQHEMPVRSTVGRR